LRASAARKNVVLKLKLKVNIEYAGGDDYP